MDSQDTHGQPLNFFLNQTSRIRRNTDECLGLLRGILADNHVSTAETEILAGWLHSHFDDCITWPLDVLMDRISRVLADGKIDSDELTELRSVIIDILGPPDSNPLEVFATNLPLTTPEPTLSFQGKRFVFTGRFASGTRSQLHSITRDLGGIVAESVTLKTDFLVIGTFGSRDWLHSQFGTKIERAVEYAKRCPLAIVCERHWLSYAAPNTSIQPSPAAPISSARIAPVSLPIMSSTLLQKITGAISSWLHGKRAP